MFGIFTLVFWIMVIVAIVKMQQVKYFLADTFQISNPKKVDIIFWCIIILLILL